MKTYNNLGYTPDNLEKFIKGEVSDRFGTGGDGRKCVVVWDRNEQEMGTQVEDEDDYPLPSFDDIFSGKYKPQPLEPKGLEHNEDVKILFEGTMEECHIYYELFLNLLPATLVIYSKKMFKNLYCE